QPRGSRQLGRSLDTALARGADAYPALLSVMRPALAPSLYGALARLDDAAPVSPLRVWALRLAVPLFGHNAPQEAQFDDGVFTGFSEWALEDDEVADAAFLDRDHPDVLVRTPALVSRPATHGFTAAVVTGVTVVEQLSRRAYGLAGKSTRVTFADRWWRPSRQDEEGAAKFGVDGFDVLRAAVVHCGAEELNLADAPLAEAVCADEIELDRLYDGLRSGRWMVLSGERADLPGTSGVRAAELVMLAGVTHRVATVPATGYLGGGRGSDGGGEPADVPLPGDALHTFVTLASPLAYCYRRDTVVLHGNVVRATHGETTQEVLGGGDPRRPRQTFRLKQPPLTWTSAPTVTGVDSTLEVRVDDVSWHEARSLLDLGPASHGYLTSQDDAGATTVVFGDAVHGARLPSGTDNVRAVYRKGIGRGGNVAAGQLSQLATRPLGIKDVVNPLPATGGADAESRDQVRRNAPLAVLALDRLVSTQDHADFARTFAGIGKAAAARLSDGRRQLVHVTVAGVDDAPIDETSDLFGNLSDALHRFGDPALPLKVSVRRLLALVLSAGVKVLPDHHWDTVEPQVRAAALAVCGFDRRELGEDVLPSQVVAAMQAVRGVDYVDLDVLTAVSAEDVTRRLAAGVGRAQVLRRPVPARTTLRRPAPERVVVRPARLVAGELQPAELAYLQPGVPDSLILNEIREEAAR
ncbi:MAG TPA: putative baseplate assembly protein, partial [Nocardioides sp.]|uniref:putative baseplate assembly protein n=1 Tax=Nocardioides sp. TaxID=35761 RepID=UPI002BF1C6FE